MAGLQRPVGVPAETIGPAAAWRTVALFCLLYVFSFVDRLALSLLISDIGSAFQMSDTEMGFLIGTSFSVVYAISGLPIAHWLDRANRKRIILAGIFLWGSMTILSGFAPSFAFLAFCRAGVALGEAVLTPAAISMIADLFPHERRTLPTALYASMATFMSVGGLAVSAAALQAAQGLESQLGMEAWRLTLVFVGLPSLLLAAIFAVAVREPPRGHYDTDADRSGGAGLGEFLKHAAVHIGFYAPLLIATALFTIFLFGVVNWAPSIMARTYGISMSEAGFLFGGLGAGVGLAAALFWPALVGRLGRKSVHAPLLIGLIAGAVLSLGVGVIAPHAAELRLFLVGFSLVLFGGNAASMLLPLVMQSHTPPRMRASGMAVLMLAQSLVGYGAGPVVVALLAAHWQGAPAGLAYGLSATAALAFPIAVAGYCLARRAVGAAPR
ncbi:MFS transporter [Sphingopyxis sp. CCNWLW253]|uniref:MFS transporter n=1 Tax=unclassified Sphingopyxis TaxID=2614943 RepID=UPI0030131111